ncbi:Tn7 transposase TnsA N-terminal domain-containing protein [Methylobacterium goesingense]|uniref:TnsA endonuclease N-terminal domain-containing protein n=1 Tax=Methylobacterium goesingense TaxID=243690 RepID=A0ABV2LEV5_9HYPH|nr:Tn7 transposase TnsA N-terminal domain-containing protein [Methylobacterium goesingense]GJD75387.1 hypothetical protein CFIICLFH_3628 [Methylobacterium goesingense]
MTDQSFFSETQDKADITLTLADLDVAARIETAIRGGPVRLVINGRHFKPVGRYTSRKARRALPWEAEGELMVLWLSEADARVSDYLTQPHKLTIRTPDGRSMVYYPDLRRDLVDRSVEIIEVKKRADDLRRGPDYARKLELARLVYAGLGWAFHIVVEEDLGKTREIENAWTVQRHRSARVTRAESFALAVAIETAGGFLDLDRAVTTLGGGPRGRAKLFAAIVQGVAETDLSQVLCGNSAIRLAGRGDPAPRQAAGA